MIRFRCWSKFNIIGFMLIQYPFVKLSQTFFFSKKAKPIVLKHALFIGVFS